MRHGVQPLRHCVSAGGEAVLRTTSQSLLRNASSPGRGAIGRPGQPCCSRGPNRAQGAGPCSHWQKHLYCCCESWQRSSVVSERKKLCSSSTTITDSPVAPLSGELAGVSPTERFRQAAANRGSGARSFPEVKNFARLAQPLPTRQWLPYQGSWRAVGETERLYRGKRTVIVSPTERVRVFTTGIPTWRNTAAGCRSAREQA